MSVRSKPITNINSKPTSTESKSASTESKSTTTKVKPASTKAKNKYLAKLFEILGKEEWWREMPICWRSPLKKWLKTLSLSGDGKTINLSSDFSLLITEDKNQYGGREYYLLENGEKSSAKQNKNFQKLVEQMGLAGIPANIFCSVFILLGLPITNCRMLTYPFLNGMEDCYYYIPSHKFHPSYCDELNRTSYSCWYHGFTWELDNILKSSSINVLPRFVVAKIQPQIVKQYIDRFILQLDGQVRRDVIDSKIGAIASSRKWHASANIESLEKAKHMEHIGMDNFKAEHDTEEFKDCKAAKSKKINFHFCNSSNAALKFYCYEPYPGKLPENFKLPWPEEVAKFVSFLILEIISHNYQIAEFADISDLSNIKTPRLTVVDSYLEKYENVGKILDDVFCHNLQSIILGYWREPFDGGIELTLDDPDCIDDY